MTSGASASATTAAPVALASVASMLARPEVRSALSLPKPRVHANRKVSELPFQIDSRVGARHARLFRKKLAMPVKILKAAGANEELGMIELQGKLHFEDVEEGEARPRVGTFSRDEGGRGEATIHTGKYRIHGERKGLKRPLAVLQKCAKRGSETTYRLVGVVREKTTFSERPDPIVAGKK